jgi:hypothetical protein
MKDRAVRLWRALVALLICWAATGALGSTSVTVSDPIHFFFAVTDSSITDILLAADIDLAASGPLWPQYPAQPFQRTQSLTVRGPREPGVYPLVEARDVFDAIRYIHRGGPACQAHEAM